MFLNSVPVVENWTNGYALGAAIHGRKEVPGCAMGPEDNLQLTFELV